MHLLVKFCVKFRHCGRCNIVKRNSIKTSDFCSISLDWGRFLGSMRALGVMSSSPSVNEGIPPPEFINSYIATMLSHFCTSSGVPVPKTKGPKPDDQSPRFTIAYLRRRTLSLIEGVTCTLVQITLDIASVDIVLFRSKSWRAFPFDAAAWLQKSGVLLRLQPGLTSVGRRCLLHPIIRLLSLSPPPPLRPLLWLVPPTGWWWAHGYWRQ